MSDQRVLNQMSITQSMRFYWFAYKLPPPIPKEEIILHSDQRSRDSGDTGNRRAMQSAADRRARAFERRPGRSHRSWTWNMEKFA